MTLGVPILQNSTTGVRFLLEIAWGADLTDLTGSTWTWTDITTAVILSENSAVTITLGSADENSQSQACNMALTLDNTSGAYSLGGQNTVNYPNVSRGTPVRIRISLDSGSTWNVQFQGNAVGFTPAWDTTGKYATVELTASGPLRQLNQGSLPATSYYAQTIPTSSLFAGLQYYWNNEGGNGTEGSNGTTLCYPTYPTGITLPSDGRVLAANIAYLPQVEATTNVSSFPISGPVPSAWDFASGTLPSTTSTGVLQFRWMCSISSLSGTQNQPLLFWRSSTAPTVTWSLLMNQNGDLFVNNTSGYTGTAVAFDVNGKVFYMQLQARTSGSNSIIQVDAMSFDGTSGGFSWTGTGATTGYLTYVNWVGPNINSPDTPIMEAHMTVQNQVQSLLTMGTFYQGNPGETVGARLTRIANAANIAITQFTATNGETSTNVADTMGGQYYDTITNLLRECEASGVGRLYDGLNIGLTFVPRVLRESQQPTMTVDAGQGAVVMPFAPIYDDQNIINQVQVSRRNGGTISYTNTASANDIGIYSSSLNVNPLNDNGLMYMAQWLTHCGSYDGYRYPTLSFELEKQPSLLASWVNCYPACRIDVTNISTYRSQHPVGLIRNVLEGWTETISQFQWHVDANCSSYEPWRVVTLAAATGTTTDCVGRYESDGSTVTTTVAAGATSFSVTTASGPKWTTSAVTADDFPLVVAINGNPITVTAITSTTSPQTFTCSALAHGIAAGSAVTVYQNAVLGM